MNEPNKPLVSAAELEALIVGWGQQNRPLVDRFFPLRFWFVAAVVFTYALALLLYPHVLAARLSSEPMVVNQMANFLYFRGWFLSGVLFIGVYAYLRTWYPGIVFGSFSLVGAINLVFDLFTVYPERLANPSVSFTLLMLLRLLALSMVFVSMRNAGRLPAVRDRLDLFLPWKKESDMA